MTNEMRQWVEQVQDGLAPDVLKEVFPVADCFINEIFTDAKEANYLRERYCAVNCGYKCQKGIEYKRKEN